MSPSHDTLAPGTLVGTYRIIALRGSGAMGAVYEAIHSVLGKRVAIKLMHAGLLSEPRTIQRFVREGQAAAAIRHPHVVQIHDVGQHLQRPYLVMEYLEGTDLSQFLQAEGPQAPQQAADVLLPIISAVAAAHDSGVVHRDLKPENIFLDRGLGGARLPKVVDFGISKIASTQHTATRAIMGSPAYMSPEQCNSSAFPASDQWALGVMLYELCTGQLPFVADSVPALMYQICHNAPQPPRRHRPDLPASLEAVILRALRKDPAERFPSVRELGAALLPFAGREVRERFAQEMGGPVRPVSTGTDWRRPALIGGACATAAAILGVLGLRYALSTPAAATHTAATGTTAVSAPAKAAVPQPKAAVPQPKAEVPAQKVETVQAKADADTRPAPPRPTPPPLPVLVDGPKAPKPRPKPQARPAQKDPVKTVQKPTKSPSAPLLRDNDP